MEAYYPIDSEESHALYQRYREEFARYGNLYFCGRLANTATTTWMPLWMRPCV